MSQTHDVAPPGLGDFSGVVVLQRWRPYGTGRERRLRVNVLPVQAAGHGGLHSGRADGFDLRKPWPTQRCPRHRW